MFHPSRFLFAVVLVAAGCKGSDPTEPETDNPSSPVPTDTGDTDVDPCGNGELDEGEACDLGVDNGPNANCFEDCTLNPQQSVVVGAGEVVDPANLDAVGVADAAAPAGAGAWEPSDTDLGGDGLAKFELNIPLYDFYEDLTPEQLAALEQAPYTPPQSWLGPIALSEISEISFWTFTPTGESGTPFYLVLYTQPDGVDDTDWFGYRLTALPTTASQVDAPLGSWVQWSVQGPTNRLAFADQPTIGTFSATGLPSLNDLQTNGAFDWSTVDGTFPSTSIDYGGEAMRFVSIQTGSGTDTTGTDARLDLIEIALTDGRSLTLDLEP